MRLNRLERSSPLVFLVGGILLLVNVLIHVGLYLFLNWFVWELFFLLFAPTGLAVSIGLLGLCPRIKDQAPRLARGSAVLVSMAGIGVLLYSLITMTFMVGDLVAISIPQPLEGIFALGAISYVGGFGLGFLMFGVAVWRTGVFSRTVAGLLVVGGVLWLAPFAALVGIMEPPEWWPFVSFGLWAIIILMIGYRLRAGGEHSGDVRSNEATATEAA